MALVAGPAVCPVGAEDGAPKEATKETQKVNASILGQLPFGDREYFDLAERGLIARAPATVAGRRPGIPVAWDLAGYSFIVGGHRLALTEAASRHPIP